MTEVALVRETAPSGSAAPVRVLIIAEQTLFRLGLLRLLEEDGRIVVVGDAEDGPSAIDRVAVLRPDVILMQLDLPELDSAEIAQRITEPSPETRIVALCPTDTNEAVVEALLGGVSAYLLTDSRPEAIVPTILAVVAGVKVMAAPVVTRVLEAASAVIGPKQLYDGLTSREVEVVKLLATGLGYKQIAYQLKISQKTVSYHLSNAYGKLNIVDRSQVVRYAIRKGLVAL